ncbi:DNA invertase Pin-like site-specific DNA recombinase [Aquibacillus albus]|uniref:DNA invertase Pin-like site-specific DNA recombinase n=2 Tax=Aquibacillus albus TaxID=1168171 RepID=A0ABS2N0A2_9BACI|nr:DNA invertase Pin-like site-specific DNA recombinase [Aquibacillus albus]
MPRAIGIVRRSSLNQKENLSFEIQEQEILTRARMEGYELIEIIKEDAESSYHKNVKQRSGMQELLTKVLDDTLGIEAVFFYDESRITRQFDDFTLYIYRPIKFEKPYVKFFSTEYIGEWDPYDLLTTLKLANAAEESIKKSMRAKDAQKTLLKEGKRPGSKIPFGYSYDEDGEITPDRNAQIVRYIFSLAAYGHAEDIIANHLNDVEIPSPKGKKWTGKTIDYILNNQFYLGHLSWNIAVSRNTSRRKQRGEYDLLQNHHEEIISATLWYLAHQVIELHKRQGKNNNTPFLIRNLLYCNSCNVALQSKDYTPSKSKKKYWVYRCPSCKSKIEATSLQDTILNDLYSKWDMKLATMKDDGKKMLSQRTKTLTTQLNHVKEQIRHIETSEKYLAESNSTNGHQWDFVLNTAKTMLIDQQTRFTNALENIDAITSDPNFDELMNQLLETNIQSFTNPEIRTIMLLFFKQIKIDFEQEHNIYVEYDLCPFTDIDIPAMS